MKLTELEARFVGNYVAGTYRNHWGAKGRHCWAARSDSALQVVCISCNRSVSISPEDRERDTTIAEIGDAFLNSIPHTGDCTAKLETIAQFISDRETLQAEEAARRKAFVDVTYDPCE